MTIERFLLIALTAASIASVFYIPKDRYRLALVSFLIFQTLTWVVIIVLVQTGSLVFPVREFPRATRAGFLLDFMILPLIYTWSVLLLQDMKSLIQRMFHNFLFISLMVWLVNFVSTYTQLQHFTKGSFVLQTIQLYAEFFLNFISCRIYVSWFFKHTDTSTGE